MHTEATVMVERKRYSIGVDFGTESGRAILVDVETGEEIATAVHTYANGVMDQTLPDGTQLDREFALQDPRDYLAVLRKTIPAVLDESEIASESVIGIGVDFTSCTILPVTSNGTPLCCIDMYQSNPHSWVK